nr:MAG TPA: single-stranded-DNA-specific exonuclease RecJ [Caudoviricetes sp.]
MNKLLWKTIHQYEFNKEDDYLARILNQAGIEDIYEFLHVNKSHTHDPFLLKNIKVGVDLLHSNLNKTIFIKRDPDVDGFTSAAYLNGFISDIAPDTRIIIGGSYQKEHGLKISDIEKYCDELSLIIIPDAGSGKESVNVYKEIREKYNIPILVIDHHEICEETMNYATVINCKDGEYPNNTLSGVGVVHKFCLAYAAKYDINPKVCEYYLDLVSLGMIADSMDMRNLETRYYALEGIKEENIHNLLIKELAIKNEDEMKLGFTLNNIGWVIAPKINGVIRYGKKEEQDDLFRAMCGVKDDREYQPRRKSKNDPKPPVEIHSLQKTMARVCTNVKQRQDKDVRLYMNELDKEIVNRKLDKNSVIIIDATEIVDKKTVTGLVANKLAEKYYRPIVILRAKDDKTFGGSGRNYDKGIIKDFRNFLNETEVFECEGHPSAFGVAIKKEDLPIAVERCNQKLKLDDLVTIHQVDYEVKADQLTSQTVLKVANSYEIWGKGVPEPSFVITNIVIPAKDIIGYGENKGFIRFTYNGVDYVKKYCCKGEWEEMTLRDRNVLGENKKTLLLTVIGNFVLNEWEGQRFPQVKIKFFESNEYIQENKKVDIDDDFLF